MEQLRLEDTVLLGKQAAGAAARCLAALPQHARDPAPWLLVSGGAREVQAAWTLAPAAAAAAGGPAGAHAACTARWLATRPPLVGLRPKRTPHFSAAQAQLRTLSLAVAPCPLRPTNCGILEAPSGGGIRLNTFDTTTHAWAPAAALCCHRFVVLSLATACAADRVLACSGGSDGSVALWDITAALDVGAAPPDGRKLTNRNKPDALPQVRPVLELPGQHQSGVNAVKLAHAGTMLCAVSGGDDQLLRVTALRRGPRDAWAVSGSAAVPCAHASAVKGLCLRSVPRADGAGAVLQVCSVGWDQYVRVWQIDVGGGDPRGGLCCVQGGGITVREVVQHAVDVSEPGCVAGCTADDGRWTVFVAGRGSQMLSLEVPLL